MTNEGTEPMPRRHQGEMIRKVARTTGLPVCTVRVAVQQLLSEIQNALVEGHDVMLKGVGTLSPTFYPSRRVRSFWRGHEVPTKVTFSVSFRRSKQLAERLDAVAKKPAAERR